MINYPSRNEKAQLMGKLLWAIMAGEVGNQPLPLEPEEHYCITWIFRNVQYSYTFLGKNPLPALPPENATYIILTKGQPPVAFSPNFNEPLQNHAEDVEIYKWEPITRL